MIKTSTLWPVARHDQEDILYTYEHYLVACACQRDMLSNFCHNVPLVS